ncbi:PR-1-like protein [Pholiota molesta]|nr:PR-1-like protein [Pholiota molesta]
MARLSVFVSFALALSSLPNALAGPACARKNHKMANCVSKCKSRWGWTGAMMNTDPWGSVVQKTDTDTNWDAVVAEACGVAVTSTDSNSSTSTALPTETAIPAPAAAAGAQPTLTSSSVSSAPTLPLSSSTSSSTVTVGTTFSSASSSTKASTTKLSSKIAVQTLGLVASTRSSSFSITRPTTTITPTVQKPSPISTTQPQSSPPPASSPSNNSGDGSTSNADIQAYLQAHNSVRAQHGASPLTWSDNLASKAQQWADNCVFKHSGGSLGPFGENLAAGTGSSYGIAAAVKSWTDEVSQYNPSNPVPSHFTQVVWKGTSQVGCAVQSCSGIFAASFGPAQFFVCEYSAQGNIIGDFAQNVQV